MRWILCKFNRCSKYVQYLSFPCFLVGAPFFSLVANHAEPWRHYYLRCSHGFLTSLHNLAAASRGNNWYFGHVVVGDHSTVLNFANEDTFYIQLWHHAIGRIRYFHIIWICILVEHDETSKSCAPSNAPLGSCPRNWGVVRSFACIFVLKNKVYQPIQIVGTTTSQFHALIHIIPFLTSQYFPIN